MSNNGGGVSLSLKVMINKNKGKVLFAEADGSFADILITFLTLPLGRILRILEKHYRDEAPAIGSLSSLYHSLKNLDTYRFVSEGAKRTLINPTSSFEAENGSLSLDITDSIPSKTFCCCGACTMTAPGTTNARARWKSWQCMKKVSGDEGFTINSASFIISDDLQIMPNETGVFGIITALGITDIDEAEAIHVDFGFTQIMMLLKASLTSPTPLSDVIFNKATQMKYSAVVGFQPMISEEEIPNSPILNLKMMVQKSRGKVLYAQVDKKFIEFLFTFLHIPVGGVENLLGGKTCVKAINNLRRSTADLIEGVHLKTSDTKERIMKPNLVHGCISDDPILPLTEEPLPNDYNEEEYLSCFSSDKFPKGKGSYLQGPRTYQVADDLSFAPYCVVSILSSLREQKIPLSDVEEVEMKIGKIEGLRILEASFRSTGALTDALLNHTSNILKKPKAEPLV